MVPGPCGGTHPACRLLKESKSSPVGVALATGFYDQAHFTNVFRNAFGVTPSVFAAAVD